MDNEEYKWILFELISALKARTTYLKSIDANSPTYNEKFYEGMALAYHLMMDEIKTQIESNNINLKQFSLHDYDPIEILNYKPLNYKESSEN
jgi:hypothetical protein